MAEDDKRGGITILGVGESLEEAIKDLEAQQKIMGDHQKNLSESLVFTAMKVGFWQDKTYMAGESKTKDKQPNYQTLYDQAKANAKPQENAAKESKKLKDLVSIGQIYLFEQKAMQNLLKDERVKAASAGDVIPETMAGPWLSSYKG
jgi:hypothetical protein